MFPHLLSRPKCTLNSIPLLFKSPFSPLLTSTTPFHTSHTTSTPNCYGVDLLPPNLQARLFQSVKQTEVPHTQSQQAMSELRKFGLDSTGNTFPLPDITPHLPPILNNNVSQHFWQVASRQVQPYTDLMLDLLASATPPVPAKWNLEPGWTRYNASDGSWQLVPFPIEQCCVFDVEVCVTEDPRAVMAIAVTSGAWYSWLSPNLVQAESFPTTVNPCSMIPMGSDKSPRLVIGHNVAYDRVRVGDEYRIDRTGTRYLDTMSMHIAVAGMTSSQRMMKLACKNMTKEELKHKPKWLENTCMNSLADVHKFYCKTTDSLDKDPRNSFVKLGLSELHHETSLTHFGCS